MNGKSWPTVFPFPIITDSVVDKVQMLQDGEFLHGHGSNIAFAYTILNGLDAMTTVSYWSALSPKK